MTKLTSKEKKHLRESIDKFLQSLRERLNIYYMVEDIDAINRLLTQVEILGSYELVKLVNDKGLTKDWNKLLDKAGKIVKPKNGKCIGLNPEQCKELENKGEAERELGVHCARPDETRGQCKNCGEQTNQIKNCLCRRCRGVCEDCGREDVPKEDLEEYGHTGGEMLCADCTVCRMY